MHISCVCKTVLSAAPYPTPSVSPTHGVPAQCVLPEAPQAAGTHSYGAATGPGYHWDSLQIAEVDEEGERKQNISLLSLKEFKWPLAGIRY